MRPMLELSTARNPSILLTAFFFAKEMFASPNVAEPLFAHRRAEPDVALRLDARFVESPHGFEHRAHARGVVADPGTVVRVSFATDCDVGACGEDRIHVRTDRKKRSFGVAPGAAADDVSDLVDRDVFEARSLHEANDFFGAGALLKGGGGNFGNVHLQGHRFFGSIVRDRERLLHARIPRDGANRREYGLVHRAGNLFHRHILLLLLRARKQDGRSFRGSGWSIGLSPKKNRQRFRKYRAKTEKRGMFDRADRPR